MPHMSAASCSSSHVSSTRRAPNGQAWLSATCRTKGLEWLFNVTLGSTAEVLRVVAMPAERLDPDYGSGLAGQQDAYDWVDLIGGFV